MSPNQFNWPSKLSFVSFGATGAESIKTLAGAFQETTGVRLQVVVEADIVKRFRWVNYGQFDFTAGFGNETSQMLQAEKQYLHRDAGPFPVAIVWSYSKSNSGFYVRSDSAIRTPRDIKPGTKIADMSSFLSSVRIVHALVAWSGVAKSDITWVPCKDMNDVAKSVLDGRSDLAYGMPRTPYVMQADRTPPGIRWIELNWEKDREGAARFKEIYPLVNFGLMDDLGTKSAVGAWGTEGINYIVTRQSLSHDLVYNLVRWLDTNYAACKDRHPDNRFRSFDILVKGLNHTYMPCHEGLITYLKEKGLWTDAHARRQQANVTLVNRYITAYQETIRMAEEKAMNISPDNADWAKFWQARKKELGLPGFKVFNSLTES